jgi:hypothetical protein
VFLCHLHHCLDHDWSLVMWTLRNLKLSTCSVTAPSM